MKALTESEALVLTRAVGFGFFSFFTILVVGFPWSMPNFAHPERHELLSMEALFWTAFVVSQVATLAVVAVDRFRHKKRPPDQR